jgi:hypothetical protein
LHFERIFNCLINKGIFSKFHFSKSLETYKLLHDSNIIHLEKNIETLTNELHHNFYDLQLFMKYEELLLLNFERTEKSKSPSLLKIEKIIKSGENRFLIYLNFILTFFLFSPSNEYCHNILQGLFKEILYLEEKQSTFLKEDLSRLNFYSLMLDSLKNFESLVLKLKVPNMIKRIMKIQNSQIKERVIKIVHIFELMSQIVNKRSILKKDIIQLIKEDKYKSLLIYLINEL